MATELPKPNEFDIETLSGVLATLQALPLFSTYEPVPEITKKALFYDWLGRPTLKYSPNCANPIDKAIIQLKHMYSLNSYEQDSNGRTTLVMVLAAEFLTLGLIFQLTNIICFSSRKCRNTCACNEKKKGCRKLRCCCFCRCKGDCLLKAIRILHGAVITVFSTLMIVF